ncbi:nonsense-mediated mRNA decay factor SMG5 [Epargyreus clarus]|uniref:nonsense-mediated mRNA decay factor SMG5 n=1 Tax=Epargyreus clarus TaxID=520877 RepID=UPI003C2F71C9
MKNESFELLESSSTSERTERAKKIYRYITDVARRLGDVSVDGRPLADLFTTNNEVLRQKLRDNCEKLFFLDPLNYGKKSLELLWRKVYYEVVCSAKKLREIDSKYDSYLFTHVVSGIGHFQHIITRIQSEMNFQFKELDYLPLHNEDDDEVVITKFTEEESQVGRSAIYSCLIYLGDLSRYQTEMFNVFEASIAARYYLQAAQIDLTSGMPFNQLGNLFVDKNYNLDSVCCYIHCLSTLVPFDGGLGNLTKIFEKNRQFCDELIIPEAFTQAEHIQITIANFLLLIEIWYLGKDDGHVTQICSTVAQQLKIALDFNKMPLPNINNNYKDFIQAMEEENVNPTYMNFNIIHNMVQICLFTIAKMNEIDNLKSFACKAFTLALLSQILQKLLKQLESMGLKSPACKYIPKFQSVPVKEIVKEENKIEPKPLQEEIIPNAVTINGKDDHVEILPKENGDIKIGSNGDVKTNCKKPLAKRRRRRRVASSGSSDLSDEETESSEADSDKSCSDPDLSDSSYESEEDSKSEDSFYDASDNDGEMTEVVNGNAKTTEPIQEEIISKENEVKSIEDGSMNKDKKCDDGTLNTHALHQFLLGNNILPSIKLLQDWILTEKDLILSCGESGDSLFKCVVDLLNIFIYYFGSVDHDALNKEEFKVFNTARIIAKKFKLEYKTIPLPEDIALRGTNIGKYDKDAAEWQILDKYKPSVYEENIIRILNFIDFGNQIAKIVPRIRYNKYLKVFYVKKALPPRLTVKLNTKKCREWHNSKKQEAEAGEGGLPQRMGRLWLASQVRELERTGQGPEPTLLVLDSAVLNKFLRRIKQLMRATNFVFLVPTVVLQELDNLKCERSSARDAIRWLEAELQSGSRFLKTQRPGQSRPLNLIKYPRKAPPNVYHFIEILEFCNHFTAEEKQIHSGNGDSDHPLHGKTAPLLILLVGNELGTGEEQCKDFSFTGAAQAAGISVEYFVDFYAKWRQTTHKSGKKR